MQAVKPDDAAATAPALEFAPPFFGSRRIATLLRQRQVDTEDRSFAQALAFGRDRPAMQLDEVTRNGESQTEAALFSRNRSFGLAKTIEHVRQELC